MTAVLAQYLSSNQDQEINVNEKRSARYYLVTLLFSNTPLIIPMTSQLLCH